SAYVDVNEIGSRFGIVATARPGESLAKVEKAIDEELARFLASGPTAEELQRVKTQHLAHFIRGLERIGGIGGKSDILAMNQSFAGSPDFSNGLKVVLAERHTIPVVNFNLQLDAGYAADQFATPGTARLAMNMLDEGTKTRSALEINDEVARLGANLNTSSDLDTSTVFL